MSIARANTVLHLLQAKCTMGECIQVEERKRHLLKIRLICLVFAVETFLSLWCCEVNATHWKKCTQQMECLNLKFHRAVVLLVA